MAKIIMRIIIERTKTPLTGTDLDAAITFFNDNVKAKLPSDATATYSLAIEP